MSMKRLFHLHNMAQASAGTSPQPSSSLPHTHSHASTGGGEIRLTQTRDRASSPSSSHHDHVGTVMPSVQSLQAPVQYSPSLMSLDQDASLMSSMEYHTLTGGVNEISIPGDDDMADEHDTTGSIAIDLPPTSSRTHTPRYSHAAPSESPMHQPLLPMSSAHSINNESAGAAHTPSSRRFLFSNQFSSSGAPPESSEPESRHGSHHHHTHSHPHHIRHRTGSILSHKSDPSSRRSSLSSRRSSSSSIGALSRQNSRTKFSRPHRNLKLTEAWPGSHHIRRLFRLFDRDGDGTITPAELRAGFESLGFDVTSVNQLKQLQQEISVDGSGLIRESQFIHAFRTLNRKAIEARLANPNGTDPHGGPHFRSSVVEEEQPVSIQLIKIGHMSDDDIGLHSSFQHKKNIPPSQLPALLKKEDDYPSQVNDPILQADDAAAPNERTKASPSPTNCKHTLRWWDICGVHQGVFALLSNHFMLPPEMLGEEIELESASHCDFFTHLPSTVPSGSSSSSSSNATAASNDKPLTPVKVKPKRPELGERSKSMHRFSSTPPPEMFLQSSLGSSAHSRKLSFAPITASLDQPALASSPSDVSTSSASSVTDAPTMAPHHTLKLLVHSLQIENYPFDSLDSNGNIKLVSFRRYKSHKVSLEQIPIHFIIVNDHTLITVRPKYKEFEPSNKDKRRRRRDSDSESDSDSDSDDEEDDPNNFFANFIYTLAESDSTSITSNLSLSSAKVLAIRLFEEIVDDNWSLRDSFKEWKIWLDANTNGEVSDQYYLRLVDDYTQLATTSVRLFKSLLHTMTQLVGQNQNHDNALPSGSNRPYANSSGTVIPPSSTASLRGSSSSSSIKNPQFQSLRQHYFSEVAPSLRLLHRTIARQFDEAQLSLSLGRILQDQYTQRGRDRSNDTLYLLTVVTTMVTPLQIATGVYGMNWENFPELKYENGYYWFWGINIALIILIGLGFKFKESVTWIRENW